MQTALNDLYYSRNLEWAHVDENLVTVGLTDFRLQQLGEILFLDLPDEGKIVHKDEVFFSMESIKHAHDFVSPVSGTIVEVNQFLIDNPSLLNDDAFNEGWIVKIEMEKESDLLTLMREPEYRAFIGAQKPDLSIEAGSRNEMQNGQVSESS